MTVKHTELFLVRHGQTDSNIAGLFHGSTDVPLNSHGLRQAELIASRVQHLADLHSLHSSPLMRAFVTAQAISRTTGLAPLIHDGLAEMHFGTAEGLTMSEMQERWPELAERFADAEDHEARFPEGESRREFHARVRETLDRLATLHAGGRLLVVAHGGVISSAIAQMLGENPNDWRKYSIRNCSLTHIELATSGPIAHVVNDVVHLDQLDMDDRGELERA
jgi:broad specificity phosphatase PhoE